MNFPNTRRYTGNFLDTPFRPKVMAMEPMMQKGGMFKPVLPPIGLENGGKVPVGQYYIPDTSAVYQDAKVRRMFQKKNPLNK